MPSREHTVGRRPATENDWKTQGIPKSMWVEKRVPACHACEVTSEDLQRGGCRIILSDAAGHTELGTRG